MNKEDKHKMKEHKKNPIIDLADSINHSQTGDLNQLPKGSLIITTIIVVIGILLWIFVFNR